MGPDLRPEPVLERRHDPSAVRVVLGIRRGHQDQVERQPDPVSADLDVALLEDVEQRHLDPFGEIGQLVDGHDSPIGPRDEAVVDGELVNEIPTLRHPDGIHVADQVGHADVGRGQLLGVAAVAVDPHDRDPIITSSHQLTAPGADRPVGMVVDLAPFHGRDLVVEELDQVADQASFGLAPLPQEDQVVPGQDPPLQAGKHRLVEPHQGPEQRLSSAQVG